MFWAEIWKISEFLCENFQFLVKFLIYFNRRVFVMKCLLLQNDGKIFQLYPFMSWQILYYVTSCPFLMALNFLHFIVRWQTKTREGHKTAIAYMYMQVPCNILPVLPQQLGHKFDCAKKKVKGYHPRIIIWKNFALSPQCYIPASKLFCSGEPF